MSLQNRIYLQNIQGIKEQSEDVHEAHGHEGQSCEEAHPDMSHDEYMDEQSDDCSCDGEEKGVCTCDEEELDETMGPGLQFQQQPVRQFQQKPIQQFDHKKPTPPTPMSPELRKLVNDIKRMLATQRLAP